MAGEIDLLTVEQLRAALDQALAGRRALRSSWTCAACRSSTAPGSGCWLDAPVARAPAGHRAADPAEPRRRPDRRPARPDRRARPGRARLMTLPDERSDRPSASGLGGPAVRAGAPAPRVGCAGCPRAGRPRQRGSWPPSRRSRSADHGAVGGVALQLAAQLGQRGPDLLQRRRVRPVDALLPAPDLHQCAGDAERGRAVLQGADGQLEIVLSRVGGRTGWRPGAAGSVMRLSTRPRAPEPFSPASPGYGVRNTSGTPPWADRGRPRPHDRRSPGPSPAPPPTRQPQHLGERHGQQHREQHERDAVGAVAPPDRPTRGRPARRPAAAARPPRSRARRPAPAAPSSACSPGSSGRARRRRRRGCCRPRSRSSGTPR